jgi:hypothetical protein
MDETGDDVIAVGMAGALPLSFRTALLPLTYRTSSASSVWGGCGVDRCHGAGYRGGQIVHAQIRRGRAAGV